MIVVSNHVVMVISNYFLVNLWNMEFLRVLSCFVVVLSCYPTGSGQPGCVRHSAAIRKIVDQASQWLIHGFFLVRSPGWISVGTLVGPPGIPGYPWASGASARLSGPAKSS